MSEELLCSRCGIEKPKEFFTIRRDRKRGHSYTCKSCKAKTKREKENATVKNNGFKICSKCNRLKHITYFFANRSVQKDGREKTCKRCRHNIRMNRLNTKPEARITENLRRRMRAVLEGINKSDSTLALIGCTPEELKNHLESQFKDGMSWENYGEWHIDHIVPCISYDLTNKKDQRKCFNFTNLQPLWAEDNLRKATSNG